MSLQHEAHADKTAGATGNLQPRVLVSSGMSAILRAMPIHLEVYHPDRIVVGVARGEVTLVEFGGFVRDLAHGGVMHYRKIIDVTGAKSSSVGKDELLAADAQLRALNNSRPRGPLAIVADPGRGELAQTFKALAADDRPVEVFRSLREAGDVSRRDVKRPVRPWACCVRGTPARA